MEKIKSKKKKSVGGSDLLERRGKREKPRHGCKSPVACDGNRTAVRVCPAKIRVGSLNTRSISSETKLEESSQPLQCIPYHRNPRTQTRIHIDTRTGSRNRKPTPTTTALASESNSLSLYQSYIHIHT